LVRPLRGARVEAHWLDTSSGLLWIAEEDSTSKDM
jgi:hypothetical protein